MVPRGQRLATAGMTRVMVLGLLAITCGGMACQCGENKQYAVDATLADQGLQVPLHIVAKATSNFTRSGAWTSHRYLFTVSYPGRQASTFSIHMGPDATLLTEEAMRQALPQLAMRVSPDKRHFAIHLPPYSRIIHFFHLLPKGEPLHVKAIDEKLAIDSLDRIDWSQVASPEQMARQAILDGVKGMDSQSNFCMLEGRDNMLSNLTRVVTANRDHPLLADTVLDVWPACWESAEQVGKIVKAKRQAAGEADAWLERLRQKIVAIQAGPTIPIRELIAVVKACRALGDPGLLHRGYVLALERWPAEYDAYDKIFSSHIKDLPTDLRERLLTQAKKTLASGTEIQRTQAKDILAEAS